MLNSFLSKVITVFGAPQKKPAKTIKSAKNRVVFTPKSKSKIETVSVKPASVSQPDQQQAKIVIQNAQRIEAKAKAMETEILRRLSSLNEKEKYLIQKEQKIDQDSNQVKIKLDSLDTLYKKQLDKLEEIADLTRDSAKQLLLSSVEKKMASWIAKKIQESKDELLQKQDELGKEILIDSIRHGITDYVAEYTVSTITLPDDTVKGKIIGREGRNIRAFEKATGVELELDETNDIRISSFDSTRREIAKISLEKLIKDGRIQPVKIERLVEQTKQDMDKILITEGKKICQEVGIYQLPLELIKQVGKYKFRYSYGQNLAKHTIEVTKIAVALANELKANVQVVRLAGLLHDIGKVVTDQEGTHIDLGIDLLRQYRIPEAVIVCVSEHHLDHFSTPESAIVYMGDAASGTRPGARYEVHEEYLKRMKNIEEIAIGFPGVTSVAAYQAGREVMVMVDPGKVSDDEAQVLAQKISEKLEEEAKWAGQIKVTIFREFKTSSTVVGSKISKNAGNNDQ